MRGESRRVAERVRELLNDADGGGDAVDAGLDVVVRDADSAHTVGAHVDAATSPRPTPRLLAAVLARVPVRLDPGRRGALAVGAAVLVAALITGAWLMAQRPRAMAVPTSGPSATATPMGSRAATAGSAPARSVTTGSPGPTSTPGAGTGSSSNSAQQLVVIDVAGKVRRPGVYRLPAGSRVDDAIRAAGGALHGVDLSSLNLAARLSDGVQVPVGVPGGGTVAGGDGVSGGGASVGDGAAGGGVVDLNTATTDQLQTLPGIGPVLAQNILDWRSAHGRFTSIDQLNDVTGIGDVKFAALKARVSV